MGGWRVKATKVSLLQNFTLRFGVIYIEETSESSNISSILRMLIGFHSWNYFDYNRVPRINNTGAQKNMIIFAKINGHSFV